MSENCNHDCSNCGEDCPSRNGEKPDFSAPANASSHVKKVIGVVSGKGGVGKSLRMAGRSCWIPGQAICSPEMRIALGSILEAWISACSPMRITIMRTAWKPFFH